MLKDKTGKELKVGQRIVAILEMERTLECEIVDIKEVLTSTDPNEPKKVKVKVEVTMLCPRQHSQLGNTWIIAEPAEPGAPAAPPPGPRLISEK